MLRTRPPGSAPQPPSIFVDDATEERFKSLKNRKVFFELGFNFSDEFGSEVKDVVAHHHWEQFTAHPGSINATLVHEFYANIHNPDQKVVYVRGKSIHFTNTAINRFFKIPQGVDRHTKKEEEADYETYQGVKEDLCLPKTELNDQQASRRTVNRERLLPHARLWNHFMRYKLMPTSHHTTVSLPRLMLLHSILFGCPMDIGRIIVHETHSCLNRPKNPLIFPNLITALCREKDVPEDDFDEILEGRKGLSTAKVTALMGNNKEQSEASHVAAARVRGPSQKDDVLELSQNAMAKMVDLPRYLKEFFSYTKKRDEVIQAYLAELLPPLIQEFPTFPASILPTAPENASTFPADPPPTRQAPLDLNEAPSPVDPVAEVRPMEPEPKDYALETQPPAKDQDPENASTFSEDEAQSPA